MCRWEDGGERDKEIEQDLSTRLAPLSQGKKIVGAASNLNIKEIVVGKRKNIPTLRSFASSNVQSRFKNV